MLRHPAARDEELPWRRENVAAIRAETVGLLGDEQEVQGLREVLLRSRRGFARARLRRIGIAFEHRLADALKQRVIAADLDLHEVLRERHAAAEHVERLLR